MGWAHRGQGRRERETVQRRFAVLVKIKQPYPQRYRTTRDWAGNVRLFRPAPEGCVGSIWWQ